MTRSSGDVSDVMARKVRPRPEKVRDTCSSSPALIHFSTMSYASVAAQDAPPLSEQVCFSIFSSCLLAEVFRCRCSPNPTPLSSTLAHPGPTP